MSEVGFSQSMERADETWDQEVAVYVGGTSPFYHSITPISGVLQIIKMDGSGGLTYWTGSAWTATETNLATTIVGNRSRYTFIIPSSANGATLTFRGWIVRNGKPTPPKEHIVKVGLFGLSLGQPVGIGFGPTS